MHRKKWALSILLLFTGFALLTACQVFTKEVVVTQVITETATVMTQETIVEQQTIIQQQTIIEQQTIIVEVTPTPEPIQVRPRTLSICLGQEPETLYLFDSPTPAARHVQEAIYDGPIDNRMYSYEPVILEKLPSLADGDAVIEVVSVETGDLVVGGAGDPVMLEEGLLVRPAGCYSTDCAVEFDGNPLEMERLVVTFKLKEGILWSNGEPLTAYDSVFSFDVFRDPDTPVDRYKSDRTANYEAVDEYTTIWTGLPGFRDRTYATNFWTPMPEHLLGFFTALELIEAEESSRTPLGWGPYVMTEWVAGDHITLVKNENYWRAGEGLPKFETLIFRFLGQNPEASIAAILSGECDIVDQTVDLDDYRMLLLELQAVGKINAVFGTTSLWEHVNLGINPVSGYDRPDFFEDVRVRQAIAYCLDRQEVIDEVLLGQSTVPDSYVPPEHPLFDPDVKRYTFDPNAGSDLLEQVGWIDDDEDPETPRVANGVDGVLDGTPLEFNYYVGMASLDQPLIWRQQTAEVLQDSLARCGIKVNLEYWDTTEYLAEGPDGPLFGRRFDMAQLSWMAPAEPLCDLYLSTKIPSEENGWDFDSGNITGFQNEQYDAACSAALQALPGTSAYGQNHLEAQRIFAEQLPAIPLFLHLKLAATRPDMKNFVMDPTAGSEFWNIENFDYGD